MVMVLSLTVQFTAVPDDMSVISDIGNLVDERELAMANIASIITNAKAGTLIFFRMSLAYIYKYVQIFKKITGSFSALQRPRCKGLLPFCSKEYPAGRSHSRVELSTSIYLLSASLQSGRGVKPSFTSFERSIRLL